MKDKGVTGFGLMFDQLVKDHMESLITHAPIIHPNEIYNLSGIEILKQSDEYIHIAAMYHDPKHKYLQYPSYFRIEFDGTISDFKDLVTLIHI